MPDDSGAALKLRAEDADDLAVISACLQDALVAVRDLAFVPQDRAFLMAANRFRWEGAARRSALRPVTSAFCAASRSAPSLGCPISGFRRSEDDRILSLLTIRPWHDDEGRRDTARIFRRGLDPAGRCPHRLSCAGCRRALADTMAAAA